MQIKKEDLRQNILDAAEKEFLKKGFKEASMRTIAKKANTTLGNIYNYFKNKEELLEAVLDTIPSELGKFFENHEEPQMKNMNSMEVALMIGEVDPKLLGVDLFLTPKFVILMEGCRDTKYEGYREKLLALGKQHVLGHLRGNFKYEKFAEIVVMTFFNGVLFIAKTSKDMEEAKSSFISLYQLVCAGLANEYRNGDESHD